MQETSSISMSSPIIILGAGIVGLQTALILNEAGLKVIILAKDFPGSKDPLYTSTWSGAQWRSNINIGNQQKWDQQTYEHWLELVRNVSPEVLGLQQQKAVYLWDHKESTRPEDSHWWTSFNPSFRVLSQLELAVYGNFQAGFEYETFALQPARYLEYLLDTCKARNIFCYPAVIGSLEEVFKTEGCRDAIGVVNCTGLGAAKLAADPNVYPSKGQTVVVSGLANRIATRRGDDWEALVIPWPGTNMTMLGGCKLPGDGSTTPDDKITEMILSRCKTIAPELLNSDGNFTTLEVRVGLRPSRHGGPRMEIQPYENKFICHAYGHDSAGYEGSVGVGREILGLVRSYIGALG